jgi:uncharacterized protein involved in type VI secretion and phage assembly
MIDQSLNRRKRRTFEGNFRGEVVDVADPLQAGRVRVRIHGVYDNLTVEQIPWALYADPFMGGSPNAGGFFIPELNSKVWCFFENADFMYPVYFAGAPSMLDGIDEAKSENSTYPNNRVFKTRMGHVIEFDDSEGNKRIRIHHTSGTEIIMEDNGDLTELVKGNVTRIVEGNITETISGNVTREITGNVAETVSGDVTRDIDGNASDNIGGSRTASVGSTDDTTASGAITLNGSTINLN